MQQVRARDDAADRRAAQQARAAPLPESERLARLRQQDHRPLVIPTDLVPWVVGHELDTAYVDAALAAWLSAMKQAERAPSFATSERLFTLTLLLAPQLVPRHERALLEHAIGVLDDVNHRNVIRCRLAVHAALERDQASAEAWLAPVDPRPTQLLADTAYRLAVCYVALTRNQPAAIDQQLGADDATIPIHDGYDDEALLLRCHALERRGDGAAAYARLRQRMEYEGSFWSLVELARQHPQLPLCPHTFPAVERDVRAELHRRLVPGMEWGGILFALLMLGAPAVGGLVLVAQGEPQGYAMAGGFGAFVALIAWRAWDQIRHRSRLKRFGVIGRAQVRAGTLGTETTGSGNNRRVFTVYRTEAEIELDGQRWTEKMRAQRMTTIPQGVYPCLVDPERKVESVLGLPSDDEVRAHQAPLGYHSPHAAHDVVRAR